MALNKDILELIYKFLNKTLGFNSDVANRLMLAVETEHDKIIAEEVSKALGGDEK